MYMSDISKKLKALQDAVAKDTSDLHPLQSKILNVSLKNAQVALEGEDKFVSLGSTKFMMWEHSINSAQKEVYAIATNRGGKSGHGFSINQKLIDVQDAAIKRGVQIHRVFPVTKGDYENFHFMEILRSQLKIGIDVWVAHDNVQKFLTTHQEYDQENYVIIDDDLLYRSYVDDGDSKNEVSFDKKLVKKYKKMFGSLLDYSYQFTWEDLPKSYRET